MTEDFLHFIWQFRLYKTELRLVTGEAVYIIHTGDHNTDSGPDFFNARVKIGDTLWAGNVEIHIKASDWVRHNHQQDRAYDSIILHVVYKHDQEVQRQNGSLLPTLELFDKFDPLTWNRYLQFMNSRSWIPCETLLSTVDDFTLSSWLERLLVERMQRKVLEVEQALAISSNDWNQAFYRLLGRNMGFKLNSEAFERLASTLSYQLLARHSDSLFQLEALVFGQAGLLNGSFSDPYPKQLKKEYEFLQKKFSLVSIDAHVWRFMRLHPGNFPTLRLSQFASIINRSGGLLMQLLEAANLEALHRLFASEASEYWRTHYRFDLPVAGKSRRLGHISSNLLVINLVAPFLFIYGQKKGDSSYIERSMELLEKSEGENNAVTRGWAKLGLDISTASRTQALLELKSHYCERKKCLSCRIGIHLLKNGKM